MVLSRPDRQSALFSLTRRNGIIDRPYTWTKSASFFPQIFFCSRRALGKPVEQPGFDSRIGEPVASPDVDTGRVVYG